MNPPLQGKPGSAKKDGFHFTPLNFVFFFMKTARKESITFVKSVVFSNCNHSSGVSSQPGMEKRAKEMYYDFAQNLHKMAAQPSVSRRVCHLS